MNEAYGWGNVSMRVALLERAGGEKTRTAVAWFRLLFHRFVRGSSEAFDVRKKRQEAGRKCRINARVPPNRASPDAGGSLRVGRSRTLQDTRSPSINRRSCRRIHAPPHPASTSSWWYLSYLPLYGSVRCRFRSSGPFPKSRFCDDGDCKKTARLALGTGRSCTLSVVMMRVTLREMVGSQDSRFDRIRLFF